MKKKFVVTLAMVLCMFVMVGMTNAATITFNDFSDSSAFTFNGSAQTLNNALRLSPSNGSAFLSDSIDLGNKGSFSTNFQFQITNSGGFAGGGDGLVFVIQTQGNSALGSGGCGMGYSGITPSVGIEFDTYQNSGDSDGNHIGINLNGSTGESVAYHNVPTSLNNGNIWHTWIDYDGTTDLMEVRLSETSLMPTDAQLFYLIDLPSILDTTNVFVGFTSATGDSYGNHDILSWQFTSVPIPGALWLFGSGLAGIAGIRLRKKKK